MEKQKYIDTKAERCFWHGFKKLGILVMSVSVISGMPCLQSRSYAVEAEEIYLQEDAENILHDGSQENVRETLREIPAESFTQTKEREGVAQTIWVDGLTVEDEDFYPYVDGKTSKYFVTKHSSENGWYDINKVFDDKDGELCAGATAANMLHWWMDQNAHYIEEYLQENPENGKISIGDKSYNFGDFREMYEQGGYVDKSRFFDFLKEAFGRIVWTDKILDLYINGYPYRHTYFKNTTGTNYNVSELNFFYKVFGNQLLTDLHDFRYMSREEVSERLMHELEAGRALGIAYANRTARGHVVTLWGADFDKNEQVVALYISDSDDYDMKVEGSRIGLRRYRVNEGKYGVRITGFLDENSGAEVTTLYTLSTGEEYWERYFSGEKKPMPEKLPESNPNKSEEQSESNTKESENVPESNPKEPESNLKESENAPESNPKEPESIPNESKKMSQSNPNKTEKQPESNPNKSETQQKQKEDIGAENKELQQYPVLPKNEGKGKAGTGGSTTSRGTGGSGSGGTSRGTGGFGSGGTSRGTGGSGSGGTNRGTGGSVGGKSGNLQKSGAAKVGKNEEKGMWKSDAKGWWYQNADGSWPKSSWKQLTWDGRTEWYYFNTEGYMVAGWQSIGGKWYYFYDKTIQGHTFGSMAADTVIDGYRLGADGDLKS